MEVAKKFLLGSATLLITVGLVYIGISIYSRAVRTADIVSKEQQDTEKEVMEHGITKYDGYEINGSTAVTYIKSVIKRHGGVSFEVTTSKGTFSITDSSHYGDFRNIDSAYYINPMAEYLVTVIRDSNGAITSVALEYVP